MTFNDREALSECAKFVMDLGGSKRLQTSQSKAKQMLDRLRLGEDIRDEDVEKLMSRPLDNIWEKHGAAVVEEIENKAVFLWHRKAKRACRNLEMPIKRSKEDNPVAIVRCVTKGNTTAKGVKSHFESKTGQSLAVVLTRLKGWFSATVNTRSTDANRRSPRSLT